VSSADLCLQDAYLEQLRGGFVRVRDLFSEASANGGVVSTVVGDSTLASRTREFYDGWDKRRTELIGALDGLAQGVVTISETFGAMDDQLAGSATDLAAQDG
jgi:hypothetical protein